MAEQRPFGDVALAINPEPRCPCVLLIDTSGSMGEVVSNIGADTGRTLQQDGKNYQIVSGGTSLIDLVNEGLHSFHTDLMNDPLAAQRIEVSVITFGGSVQTIIPFATAHDFIPPKLIASGETPMGAAIIRAIEAVAERKRLYRQHGLHYYRPWIFFMTDGKPTDAWQTAAQMIRDGEENKAFAFFAVGIEGADFSILKQISIRKPLHLKEYNFREMFVWLSRSQRKVSQSKPGQENQVQLASPSGWASL
ncbi:MAG: VWA domain-containing protein [Planctomycetia bacterium]|nr:VWA domain-containing protein [Planctomycetia bacterium]